jgi:hypothetical protein
MKKVCMYIGTGVGESWKTLPIPENLVVDGGKAEGVISSVLSNVGIQCFTLIEGKGFWEGKPEKSLVITIYSDIASPRTWYDIAKEIGNRLFQDCILLDLDGDVCLVDSMREQTR